MRGVGLLYISSRPFLQPPPIGNGVSVRVYVDDITVSVVAPTAWGVVRALGLALPKLRGALGAQGVVLSQPTEQFFSPTQDVISLWNRVHPQHAGHIGKSAKDLGASQRAVGRKSTMRGLALQRPPTKLNVYAP